MAKLTEDISEVHSIMTKNIQDVLNHGERLDSKHPLISALLLLTFVGQFWVLLPRIYFSLKSESSTLFWVAISRTFDLWPLANVLWSSQG